MSARADKLFTWRSLYRLEAEGAEGMSAQCCTVLVHLMLMTHSLIVVSSTIQLQSPLHLG